jgi:hypothetical protein
VGGCCNEESFGLSVKYLASKQSSLCFQPGVDLLVIPLAVLDGECQTMREPFCSSEV